MKVDRERAFVLHTRDYRESSQLVDLLTPNFGRVRLVSRGSRKQKKLQPFAELEVSWSGKTELKTLTQSEAIQSPLFLQGYQLYSGLYINELLTRLVHESDAHIELYTMYGHTLASLCSAAHIEIPLRQFERLLLQELGYGLELSADAQTGEPIENDQWYWFEAETGLQIRHRQQNDNRANWFYGSHLLALNNNEFEQPEVLRDAKRLHRLALKPLLGNKPLQSRDLFSPTLSVGS